MRQMAGNLFGQDPEPPGLHDGPYRGACPLDNRFPVENLLIGDNVTMLCRSHRTLLGSYTDALQGLLQNRMSAAIKEPNARAHLLPEAGATQEAVRCSGLFGPPQRLSLHTGLHLRPAHRRPERRRGVSLPA